MQDDARFSLPEGVQYETLGEGEDAVLLSMESGYLYRCNHTAVAMLRLLEQRATFDEVVTCLSKEFGVEDEQVRRDAAQLVDRLLAERILEKAA